MRKGSILPVLLIVTTFLLIPLVYWYFNYSKMKNNIKGIQSGAGDNGFYITIDSTSGRWDLNSFLCEDKDNCLEYLESGKRLETISGGKTTDFRIHFKDNSEWDNYSYLKIYVKGGWGNQEVFYNPIKMGDITGAQLSAIEEQALTSKVVLIPLEEVRNGYYIGPEFSD